MLKVFQFHRSKGLIQSISKIAKPSNGILSFLRQFIEIHAFQRLINFLTSYQEIDFILQVCNPFCVFSHTFLITCQAGFIDCLRNIFVRSKVITFFLLYAFSWPFTTAGGVIWVWIVACVQSSYQRLIVAFFNQFLESVGCCIRRLQSLFRILTLRRLIVFFSFWSILHTEMDNCMNTYNIFLPQWKAPHLSHNYLIFLPWRVSGIYPKIYLKCIIWFSGNKLLHLNW